LIHFYKRIKDHFLLYPVTLKNGLLSL